MFRFSHYKAQEISTVYCGFCFSLLFVLSNHINKGLRGWDEAWEDDEIKCPWPKWDLPSFLVVESCYCMKENKNEGTKS